MTPRMSYNPRYEIYARAHGESSTSMLVLDRERWPGGCMAGFQIWISEHWERFCVLRGFKDARAAELALGVDAAQEAFSAWLETQA